MFYTGDDDIQEIESQSKWVVDPNSFTSNGAAVGCQCYKSISMPSRLDQDKPNSLIDATSNHVYSTWLLKSRKLNYRQLLVIVWHMDIKGTL